MYIVEIIIKFLMGRVRGRGERGLSEKSEHEKETNT